MSKLLSIDSQVTRQLNGLPKNERIECLLALCALPEAFGRQHVHSGLGIRKMERMFEFRGNVSMRFLFVDRPYDLYIFLLGNHDEVRTFLRSSNF